MGLVEFTCEVLSRPGLVCRIFKNYEFSFTSSELLIQMIYFFLIQFWWAVYFFSLQYSCLEDSMDRGARWASVHGVTKNWTRLSD